jgi:hypothetical protein
MYTRPPFFGSCVVVNNRTNTPVNQKTSGEETQTGLMDGIKRTISATDFSAMIRSPKSDMSDDKRFPMMDDEDLRLAIPAM